MLKKTTLLKPKLCTNKTEKLENINYIVIAVLSRVYNFIL